MSQTKVRISVIIATHNRASSLSRAIDSVESLQEEADIEVVVVDNNSADETRKVTESHGGSVRYVFEPRTASTRALRTGAELASGDILVYLDDDAVLHRGSLRAIAEIFGARSDCGIIAGRISPLFVEQPPAWTLECQKSFNGWSLYNEETYPFLKPVFQEVPSACGPLIAVRRNTYTKTGGFSPNTIGIETNRGPKSFNKLYVGPGEWGLCIKARREGFKIYSSPTVLASHVIPPTRLTIDFWRSRMIGEGYYLAIADRAFFRRNEFGLALKRWCYGLFYEQSRVALRHRLDRTEYQHGTMSPDELWLHFYKAYLDMDIVLQRYPEFWKFLWQLGYDGVDDENYDDVTAKLPADYRRLVSNEFVYNSLPIDGESSLHELTEDRGYYRTDDKWVRRAEVYFSPGRDFRKRLKRLAHRKGLYRNP